MGGVGNKGCQQFITANINEYAYGTQQVQKVDRQTDD